LGTTASTDLHERVRRAQTDADMVAKLEEIRLRLSVGRRSLETAALSPERMYADAFQNYGITLLTLEPAEAAAAAGLWDRPGLAELLGVIASDGSGSAAAGQS
jgi:hypothetical protein